MAIAPGLVPLLVSVLSVGVLVALGMGMLSRRRARFRLIEGGEHDGVSVAVRRGPLARRLALAGRRGPHAAGRFLAATAALLALGCLAAFGLHASGSVAAGAAALRELPGAFGDLAAVVIELSPVIVSLGLALIPLLVVRAERRARVRAIEQDLPLALELLATLGEAGFSFDAAVNRLLDVPSRKRPLTDELRFAQSELRAGVPRVRAFRHLAARVGVPAMTILVSAIVQAEQVGAGTAGVLRRQADDLRARRREDALARAQALPVKLVFPLVICFLPSLFVVTLGPVFHQFARLADSALRNAGR